MRRLLALAVALLVLHPTVRCSVTEAPDDDDDWEEPAAGSTTGATGTGSASSAAGEADDDGRVYKNPRNSPSALCPRDEEQATLLGQKCLRKCSSDEDCKSKKKKCLCDGACGMSCIKPDRECPELEKPEVGDVTVSGRLFGDKAIYSCPHGFHVVGLQSRNCQADGQWAGQPPACKQNIYCLTPPHIEHARHSALPEQATFDLDATIQYHCHTGYVTNGFPRAKCLAIEGQASWYGPDITCEPRSCGPPGELPHGWVTAECHTYGCRATLHCGAGFELVGKAERFCQSDGTWAPNELPTCVLVTAVQCPVPEGPRHGRAIYTSCAYNSIVSYECKYGYRLVGDNTRRCGADKKWSGTQPVCKEINCGHPGRLYNGWLENIETGTGLGASIIFRCHEGMRMEGNSSTVCQADGTWRYPLPKCLAPCVIPHVTQGKVELVPKNISSQETNSTNPSPTTQLIGSSTMAHHGDALIVGCEMNYEFLSNNPAVSCNNGTWTQIPKCQPARCKRLPKPPRNGMVVAPKTEHGMRARFHCKDGFELQGPDLLLCSYGNWTGEMPICQEVYCPFPGYIANGKILLVGNMGLYDYRPYVKKVINNKQIMYECDKGYVLLEGPPGATCIGGHWSPKELPNCTLGQHPRLRWSRRRRSLEINKMRYDRLSYLKRYYDQLWKKSLDISRQLMMEKIYNDLNEQVVDENLHLQLSHLNPDIKLYSVNRVKRNTDNYMYNDKYNKRKRILSYLKFNKKKYKRIPYDTYKSASEKQEVLKVLNSKNSLNNGHTTSNKRITRFIKDQNIFFENEAKFLHDYNSLKNLLEKYIKAGTSKNRFKRNTSESLILIADNSNRKNESYEEYPASVFPIKIEEYLSYPNIKTNVSFYSPYNQNSLQYKSLPKIFDDELFKRTKRTSRKTEKLNQTTATVPKSNKENKGRQINHETASTIETKNDEEQTITKEPFDYQNNNISSEKPLEKGAKKGRVKGPCEMISSEPYVNVEIVKYGRDPNISYSSGTIVRVACGKGYELNLGYNTTAKCIRGRWKPMKPQCDILPCHIPVTENGIFSLSGTDTSTIDNDVLLNDTSEISNGQVIQFACEPGFNVQGASNLRCWHGEWTVTSMPECIPAPCELPVVRHGVYTAGYRAGLTIAHGASVALHCEIGYAPPTTFSCELGNLRPHNIELCMPIQGNISNIREGQDFRGGSDIVREDFDELEYPTSLSNTECGPPARVQGTLIYRDGVPMNSTGPGTTYPHGTEVTFRCIASIMGERSTWKILCERGNWIGKSISCEEEETVPSGLLGNGTCTFRNNEPNVVSFFNDLEIKEELVEFPAGAILISRCMDIGKYAMTGPNKRKCLGGEWNGPKPSCFGLNQENDYAMEKPPTILFRHQLGPIAQSNDGRLIVYPGTILHMECLWMRRFGNPKWNVSHEYRKYPEGWSSDPGRDSALEYRLSIFHATKDDSGVFSCVTPARQSHQVEIVVEAIHCAPLPLRRGLISSSQSTKMSSIVMFSCANGNSLIGAAQLTCLPSGNWSAPLPLCESVECGEVVVPGGSTGKLRVAVVSRGVGGRAAFSCTPGWGLRGPHETLCLPNGEWAQPFPTCVEVSCPAPQPPVNGYLLGRAPFRAGDVVQFNCNPAHMMQGQPIVACQDNARWSGETPKCIQACSYPGTTISGRMSSVKFYYKIGETISFTCEPGLQLQGAPMLRCLRNGKWSNAIPICSREANANETYLISDDSDRLAMLSDDGSIYVNTTQNTILEKKITKVAIAKMEMTNGSNKLPLTNLQRKVRRIENNAKKLKDKTR